MARKRCLNRALHNLPGVDGNFGSCGLHVIKVNGEILTNVTQGKVLKHLQNNDTVILEIWEEREDSENSLTEKKLVREMQLNKELVGGKAKKIVEKYREKTATYNVSSALTLPESDMDILQKIQEKVRQSTSPNELLEETPTENSSGSSASNKIGGNKVKEIFKKIVTTLKNST